MGDAVVPLVLVAAPDEDEDVKMPAGVCVREKSVSMASAL